MCESAAKMDFCVLAVVAVPLFGLGGKAHSGGIVWWCSSFTNGKGL